MSFLILKLFVLKDDVRHDRINETNYDGLNKEMYIVKSNNELYNAGREALTEIHDSLNNVHKKDDTQKINVLRVVSCLLSYDYKGN